MKVDCSHRSTIFAAVVFLVSNGNVAVAGGAPAWLMTGGQRVPDVDLPAEAMRGSGIASGLNPAALGAPGLLVSLSDGRVLHAARQRTVEDPAHGRQAWIGTFADQPGSLVVLSKVRGVTTGFITYGTETFEIVPTRGGRHVLYEVDASKLATDDSVLLPDDTAVDAGATTGDITGGAMTGTAFVHDLLVVYTPASRVRYGQATLESMIVAAVAAANQAYLNSGVNITLNLVGLQEIDYTGGTNLAESLSDLQGKSDGKMDSVHVLRDLLGADVVSLVSEDTGCGIAFLMTPESSGFASSAFNAVYSGCLSQHSLAHEVGHNQGNMHDRANSSFDGAFPYSHGLRRCVDDGTGFRTVMSYSCIGANRVTQFSNPDVSYNGWPTGISYEADPANSADNVRSMNETADTVAAFRGASTSAPLAPSYLGATALSAESVRLGWVDNATDEAGFKVERSVNGVDFDEITTLGADTTVLTDSVVTPLMTYWYRVRSFNGAGHSAFSNEVSLTMPDVPPTQPADVTALDNADGSASVGWADVSGNETGFEVRRETWDQRRGLWKSLTTVGTVPADLTSLVDVAGNGKYRYSVRALGRDAPSGYGGPAEVSVTGASKGAGKGRTR